MGALGWVGRGFGPAGRAGLGWAWGLAVLGALGDWMRCFRGHCILQSDSIDNSNAINKKTNQNTELKGLNFLFVQAQSQQRGQ